MKKLIVAVCMMFAIAVGAKAQVGAVAVGVDFGLAPCTESWSSTVNFEFDGKVQFNVLNDIRLEGKLSYGVRDHDLSMFTLSANAHYMIGVLPRFKVYPLVGIGYARPTVHVGDFSDSGHRFLFNMGAGGELAITDNISANLEFKYQYVKDFQRFPITVGVAYKF